MFEYGVPVAYCPSMDVLQEVLLEVKPTIFVGVPRLYEKVRSQVEAIATGAVKRPLFEWALRVGRAYMDEVVAGRRPTAREWRVADRLVFSKIAAGFGGRGRFFFSGGAPLGRDLASWYATVGIRIFEGYGLTETSPVISINTPQHYRLGTVGKPLPNVECRIADDGEILVRGPSIFKGYWNKPEETAASFDDGWFKTGDVGALDEDGFLSITDRKKDLIKTSGGKFIAPQPIETALKANELVAQATVIGDRRKFPAVIIAPHFASLEHWARANDVAFASRAELVSNPKVQALYQEILENLNHGLAQFEKLKRFLLVPDEFSIAGGEMTPTLKLKRRVIETKYRDQIDTMYAVAEKSAPQPAVR
jgi:long-chain acyl-CoA synthetase